MANVKIAMIDPEQDDFQKETSSMEVDMEVQSFEECISGIESPEEVNSKVIKYLEKIIRKSYEYKQYINYLKNELDIKSCVLMPNINIDELNVSLEFHHYPITLYDIAETILTKHLATRKKETDKISMFDVMEEVMEEHYAGHIGLVPLTKTMHEMAHSGSIKIPYESVYGSVDEFVAKYKKYMRPDLIDKTQDAKLINKEYCEKQNKDKLSKTVLHYNINYNKENDK